VELDDDYASTSSIMPQKKNPDAMELVRGRTGDATAGLEGLLTTLKSLPRAYNRDLQRAGRHAWDAVDSVAASVPVAVGAVATAEWPTETLATVAGDGFTTATGVADLLAGAGVPFRTAHEVVARAAEAAERPGIAELDAAAEAVLDEPLTAYVDRAAVEAALDPAESVASRDSRGGPAPAAVRASVDRATRDVEADRAAVADRRERVERATDRRRTEVDSYV
jgi:argininosuccinate lyase